MRGKLLSKRIRFYGMNLFNIKRIHFLIKISISSNRLFDVPRDEMLFFLNSLLCFLWMFKSDFRFTLMCRKAKLTFLRAYFTDVEVKVSFHSLNIFQTYKFSYYCQQITRSEGFLFLIYRRLHLSKMIY